MEFFDIVGTSIMTWSYCMQIRDSNRAMLLAAAMQYQCNILDLGIAKDNKSDIEMLFDKALAAGAHILLSSGGVSMGDKDLVKPILKIKGNVHFDKVYIILYRLFKIF